LQLFATPARIAVLAPDDLMSLGLTRARAGTLIGLAAAMARGDIRLEPESDVDATIAALTALPGIGPWTANYIAMRALRWPDAFLPSDLGVLKAMGETRPANALRASELWRPWRSYAVIHLWSKA
jgi:AraC family transcriptional regulator of adaptative response / DNA-3-methyladenine glycosylase II